MFPRRRTSFGLLVALAALGAINSTDLEQRPSSPPTMRTTNPKERARRDRIKAIAKASKKRNRR